MLLLLLLLDHLLNDWMIMIAVRTRKKEEEIKEKK